MKLDHQKLERLRERGGKLIARCPACHEIGGDTAGDNLTVFPNDVFACAAYQGDRAHSKRILELAGLPQTQPRGRSLFPAPRNALPHQVPHEARLPPLSMRQVRIIHTLAKTLVDSPSQCHQLAVSRQWQDATVRHAALDLSLGWGRFGLGLAKPDAGCPDEALCFLYPAGVKVRFLDRDGGKTFRWLKREGLNVQSLWRLDAITPETETVWVTEGEPDALRLMDLGVGEERATREAVCALPSASYRLSREELDRLRGRQVIFCPDNDHPGQKAAERLAQCLQTISINLFIRPVQ